MSASGAAKPLAAGYWLLCGPWKTTAALSSSLRLPRPLAPTLEPICLCGQTRHEAESSHITQEKTSVSLSLTYSQTLCFAMEKVDIGHKTSQELLSPKSTFSGNTLADESDLEAQSDNDSRDQKCMWTQTSWAVPEA